VIDAQQVMPLLLDACPSFARIWTEVASENALAKSDPDDRELMAESPTGRLDYLDAAEFRHHMVTLHLAGDCDEFPAIFQVIERLLVEGDDYVRNLAVIGYLEGFRMKTVTDSGIDPEAVFRPLLLPVSERWWRRIDDFWEGDVNALQVTDP
jgi:hypothetical protein